VLDVGVEAELQGALAAQVDRLDALTPATQVVPTGATLEELKALGYLQ
jgi:hypothetical protein